MEYFVRFTQGCKNWLYALTEEEKISVLSIIELLKEYGPQLPYPYSSKINSSKYSHLRELRIQHKGQPYRILYAFDPQRIAILLVGGNKIGDNRWYKKNILLAEKLYTQHLKAIGEK
jgi:hypothetical protein